MREIKAPNEVKRFSIFLAGSIEQGRAQPWQEQVANALTEYDIDILNPKRDEWDPTWEQSVTNKAFKDQVTWELRSQETCDFIFMYFDKDTLSPISLLELGLFAKTKKMVVCCPGGFWRKGNVDVVCQRYNIPRIDDLAIAIQYTKQVIEEHIYA